MVMVGRPNSKAPMSLASPPLALAIEAKSNGRGAPRWSVSGPQFLPWSIAGLPARNAQVRVGPPLFARAVRAISATLGCVSGNDRVSQCGAGANSAAVLGLVPSDSTVEKHQRELAP